MDWNPKEWNINGMSYSHPSGASMLLKNINKGWFGNIKLTFEIFFNGKRISVTDIIVKTDTNWYHAYAPYYKAGETVENYCEKKGIKLE